MDNTSPIPSTRKWNIKILRDLLASNKNLFNIACGFTPSNRVHLGTIREISIASYVGFLLNEMGKSYKCYIFIDDLDPLLKIPSDWESYMSKYIGVSICHTMKLKPDCKLSLGFQEDLVMLNKIFPNSELVRMSEIYQEGQMENYIASALKHHKKIRDKMSETMSTAEKYMPVHGIDDSGKLISAGRYKGRSIIGEDGQVELVKGRYKLSWKIDWPARWNLYNIDFECSGKDVIEGSFDDAAWISQNILDGQVPISMVYEYINDETGKKMSKSLGNYQYVGSIIENTTKWNLIHWLLYKPYASRAYSEESLLKNIDKIFEEAYKYKKLKSNERVFEPVRYIFNKRIPAYLPNKFKIMTMIRKFSYIRLPEKIDSNNAYQIIRNSSIMGYLGSFVKTSCFMETFLTAYSYYKRHILCLSQNKNTDSKEISILKKAIKLLKSNQSCDKILHSFDNNAKSVLQKMISRDENCHCDITELLAGNLRTQVIGLLSQIHNKGAYVLIPWEKIE